MNDPGIDEAVFGWPYPALVGGDGALDVRTLLRDLSRVPDFERPLRDVRSSGLSDIVAARHCDQR